MPYFKDDYIAYLSNYRFKPDQVHIEFTPSPEHPSKGDIDILISGPWHETILWEVPLMACLSEVYFRVVDTDWNYEGQAGLTIDLTNTDSRIILNSILDRNRL
jgi:nicotinate phosphoribosyltransferase